MKITYNKPLAECIVVQLEGCIATSMQTANGSANSDRGLSDIGETDYNDDFDW